MDFRCQLLRPDSKFCSTQTPRSRTYAHRNGKALHRILQRTKGDSFSKQGFGPPARLLSSSPLSYTPRLREACARSERGSPRVSSRDRNSGRLPNSPDLPGRGSNSLLQRSCPRHGVTFPAETKPLPAPSNQLNGRDIGQRVGQRGRRLSESGFTKSEVFEIGGPPVVTMNDSGGPKRGQLTAESWSATALFC